MGDSDLQQSHTAPEMEIELDTPDAAGSSVASTDGTESYDEEVPSLDWRRQLEGMIETLRDEVRTRHAEILKAFQDKLAFDTHKEEQIDRLHAELQTYKSDLVARSIRPLVHGIIRLHDDLGRMTAALAEKPEEELTPKRFFRAFEGFADDIELLLGQHGVEAFRVEGDTFDPSRQTAVRTVPHAEDAWTGRIASRLRPGFTKGDTLLQRERVAVYSLSITASAEASPNDPTDSQETHQEDKDL